MLRAHALMAALLASACASWPRVSTPPLPPPAGAEFLGTSDGLRLYSAVQGPGARGVVWFVMGAEISAAPPYPALTRALHEAGFATAVVHPRGTGFSDGLRGDVDDYARFLGDYCAFLAVLQGRFERVFLVGHSAGAAFALEVAVAPQKPLAGLVLVNPAWKLRTAEGMSPSFGDYVTFAANLVFRPAALTVDMNSRPESIAFAPDREEGLAMQRDPLVVRYFSMRTLSEQGRVMARCAENVAVSAAPLLLVQGAHDAMVEPASLDELLAKAAAVDKRKLVAPDGGHGSSAVETQVAPLVEWFSARAPP